MAFHGPTTTHFQEEVRTKLVSSPSLHGSLSPQPRDRDIRAGTVSISTAGAICLAVIAAALVPGSPIYAILTAAGVALGAASVIAQLRHRNAPRLYQWLSALGGLTILVIGIIVAVSRLGASPMLATAGMVSSFYLIPFAALACFVGGLGQLPVKWIGPTLLATGGAAAAGWFSLGDDSLGTTLSVSLAACLSIAGCVFPVVRATKKRPHTLPSWLILISAILMAVLMLYTIGLALLPQQVPWPWVSPIFIAWAYLVSGILATAAGLLTSSRS